MTQKPSLPKGVRDFSPLEAARRKYISDTLSQQFKKFGFQAIETPSFEQYDTLMGKYGEEGDRLIFKILNSGDYLSKVPASVYAEQNSKTLAPHLCEKALRYDLTVPFARYVVQHQNELTFPFKRYQIQPVWRADRPQKGRFREFYQCDADVVGSQSLWQEVELIQLYDAAFSALGIKGVTLRINHRKILGALAELMGASDKLVDFTVALDKLDKIGKDRVIEEMLAKGISQQAVQKMLPIFDIQGDFSQKCAVLEELLSASEQGREALQALRFISRALEGVSFSALQWDLDITLARGLNYYTGAIFEVAPPQDIQMGALGGGGRYDSLTAIFGLNQMSGVGISFGLDRIYLVMEELGLFPEELTQSVEVLCINFGEAEALRGFQLVTRLRALGISAELYPDSAKMKKQLMYADRKQIPWVILVGEQELQTDTFVWKNMQTGEQQTYPIADLEAVVTQINK